MRLAPTAALGHLLPRRTIRLRLAVLYGGAFFVSGAVLLAITYGLVTQGHQFVHVSQAAPGPIGGPPEGSGPAEQRNLDLHVLQVMSLIALAIMAAVSVGLGWWIAGRVLRPLRSITTTAREISARSLDRRIALDGPDDEFKELGDTFNGLLARLDASFQSQRRFVANASHELRTPLARLKTLVQVALADPHASGESLRAAHERVLASEEQLEGLIDALFALADSERGLDRREPFDLAVLAGEVLASRRPEIEHHDLRVDAVLDNALAEGSPRLVERLVSNLVDNAIRHNVAPGEIDITTSTDEGYATLRVANTGPLIAPEDLDALQQSFTRGGADRIHEGHGHGLGLSIVHAIAASHGADVLTRARANGGLEVEVRFPIVASGIETRA